MSELGQLIKELKADYYRYEGATRRRDLLLTYMKEPGARFTFWLRVSAWLKRSLSLYVVYIVARLIKRHYEIKFGYSIPARTEIGPGLYFSHFGNIVVNGRARIGRNCNISHGVTIGQSNRGRRKGCPIIGDNVFIGPGAKIFGEVRIGNNVAIGANSVVTSDVPDSAVVVGNPARVTSANGSVGYIMWTSETKAPSISP